MRHPLSLLAILTLLLALAATAGERAVRVETVRLSIGDAIDLGGVEVLLSGIVDSRCPRSVMCVWAGSAVVRLESAGESLELYSDGAGGPVSGVLRGVSITLEEVAPQRLTPERPPERDYSALLRFEF